MRVVAVLRRRVREKLASARSAGPRALAAAWDFGLCASLGFFALLLIQIGAGHPDLRQLRLRAVYLIVLACRYTLLWSLPVWLLHALRTRLLGRGLRADRWVALLLALCLFGPTYRQAELLTTGGLLFGSSYALPVRGLLLSVLLSGNLVLWQLHLWLCRAPAEPSQWRLSRLLQRFPRWLRVALAGLCFVAGAVALGFFVDAVDQSLRAYMSLSQYLLPSAWLLAASLSFGVLVRLGRRRLWLRLTGSLVLGVGLLAALLSEPDLRHVRAEFERRGGVIALSELATSIERGAPFANLDVSQPARLHCPAPAAVPAPSAIPTAAADRRNVILISVDTLRKDALTMQSEGKPAAPYLRSLSAHSLFFERAVTTYPATLFAVGSALTGLYPSEILFSARPPENLFTRTRAVVQRQIIALPNVTWFRRPPVPQLFTQVAKPRFFSRAHDSTSFMISQLAAARAQHARTLAWIHYYDPHTSRAYGHGRARVLSKRRSYAVRVRRVDAQIARLMHSLERMGYLDDSLVIVFSDHGEALGEFDYFAHHVYLNQFLTDVPLLVLAKGLTAARSPRQVTLADIAPTVYEWLGVHAPPTEARSLFAADGERRYGFSEAFPVRGRALYELAKVPITGPRALAKRMRLIRTAAFKYQPKVALVSSRYRLIVNRITGSEEFYDRVLDPHEEHDLSQDGLLAERQMRHAMGALHRRLSERIYCKVSSER